MHWLPWGVLLALLLALTGCGGQTQSVEKTDPLPRQRFPKPDR